MEKEIDDICNHFVAFVQEAIEIKSIGLKKISAENKNEGIGSFLLQLRIAEARSNFEGHITTVVDHHPEANPDILRERLTGIAQSALDQFSTKFE